VLAVFVVAVVVLPVFVVAVVVPIHNYKNAFVINMEVCRGQR
jgi:hypothetical protein